jgi:glycosyltransferase involved in cell wall biosynthesis
MNIGINASFLRKPHTGIGQVTTHFLKTLIDHNKSGHTINEHHYFIYTEEESGVAFPENFTQKTFLPKYKRDDLFRKLLWEKFYLPRRARIDRCDVLISLYQSATVIHYIDMQHIMIVHDIIPHIFPEYLNNLRKKIYWGQVEKGIYASNKIVTVSEYTKIDLESRLNVKPYKMSVSQISVDQIFAREVSAHEMERVMKKYDLEEGEYLYTGGGLEMRKDVDRTLRAYKRLIKRNPDVPKLVVSGRLMPKLAPLIIDVEQVVRDLNLVSHVVIMDFVPQEDLPALYKGAMFFVYPSLYEGFGMPVLESMHMGTPVITTRDTSIYEVGGDAVMYVDHDDEDLCNKMSELLRDGELRRKMSDDGKSRAQNFSWDNFVQRVFDVIDS